MKEKINQWLKAQKIKWCGPEKAWHGTCCQCKKEIHSYDPVPKEDEERCICLACAMINRTMERIKREKEAADRHQIELYKRAIREIEQEKTYE